MSVCRHLDQVRVAPPAGVAGGEYCLRIGGHLVHLRACLTCGHVGCCDSSPHRHATAHARGAGHPLVASVEPGEERSYCYLDDIAFVVRFGELPARASGESG